MKKYILLALVMCRCVLVLGVEAPKKSTDANIFGHVVDRDTHEHIPYATIAVTGTAFGTTTDASGHYFLKNYTDGGDKTIHEMAYNKTKWNAFWNDKYYRAPYGKYSQVPLIRLAEAYLTRATLVLSKNASQALGDVNKIRQRAGLTPLKNVTEADIEKERIKEFGFENGDRLLYLVAMQKTIDGQKRNPGAVYDNPNTDGEPIPAMNPPYSTMYVPLPSIEYLYSGSYQQP